MLMGVGEANLEGLGLLKWVTCTEAGVMGPNNEN